MLVVLSLMTPQLTKAQCSVDGINYDSQGVVESCEGGGNWCLNAPYDPYVCKPQKTKPPSFLQGMWRPLESACKGQAFYISEDTLSYLDKLEPLGEGEIQALRSDEHGGITIETMLYGAGGYIRFKPSEVQGVFFVSWGRGDSREAFCRFQKTQEAKPPISARRGPRLPEGFLGRWSYWGGLCRGQVDFVLRQDAIDYRGGNMRHFGLTRIVDVRRDTHRLTLETSREGEGRFLSLWGMDGSVLKADDVLTFGTGATRAESRKEVCHTMRYEALPAPESPPPAHSLKRRKQSGPLIPSPSKAESKGAYLPFACVRACGELKSRCLAGCRDESPRRLTCFETCTSEESECSRRCVHGVDKELPRFDSKTP